MSTDNLPAEIRDALTRLDALDVLPTSAHVEVFEEMNRRLADALADLDGSGSTAVPAAGAGGPRPGPGAARPTR
ncbi:conserved hypothetical protein [Frankia canadensis]|uniref:Uncharacterized protein n=1 Tax=Frankia canadensis TaxID=1836972 RepID=A0A2I2KT93_9ACTN|nr:hypothetical protein [Frankia canadensis]SNQ48894.1 conserved hypothetical protein [Frankia canadensis]SOU56184.1 conserved hypothetical protein [Frankia canadensis]